MRKAGSATIAVADSGGVKVDRAVSPARASSVAVMATVSRAKASAARTTAE
jgi:hypothetical protein